MGTRSFATAATSRAVPSPPQNRISSTPDAMDSSTMIRVSSEVLGCPGTWTTSIRFGGTPAIRSGPVPMSPPAVTHWQVRFGSSFVTPTSASANARARSGAVGFAPAASACSATPSVPLRPTRPPRPAIGFTMKPTLRMCTRRGPTYFALARSDHVFCVRFLRPGARRHARPSSAGGETTARWATYPRTARGSIGQRTGARPTAVDRPAAIPS